MDIIAAADLLRSAARINVIGTSGSGKSVLSRRLAALLQAPHVEIDSLFWRPGWQQTPDADFHAAVAEAVAAPRWVLDGNYSGTIPVKWSRVDAVVWLDYPFITTFGQMLGRTLRRAWTREELWPGTGNRESFAKSFFSRDSILWWMITTHGKTRRSITARMADPAFAHIRFVRLRSRTETEALLLQMQASARG